MASPTEISVSQLARLIGTAACPLLVDVRIDEDFDDDPRLIPGAVRHRFSDINSLNSKNSAKIVIYCKKGHKISQGAAAILRADGFDAETLEGGQFAWRDADMPMVDALKIPKLNADAQSVWVTRQRPKIDRIASPWLIRRFIDPNAQFLFVAASQVQNVAEKFDATAFDTHGGFWSHEGENCTFDKLLSEFGLKSEALDRLARIVRGADTDKHDLAPECAGLLAASLGLSRIYRDDTAQLEAGMLLYDSFYRWARDAVDEGHDWPATA